MGRSRAGTHAHTQAGTHTLYYNLIKGVCVWDGLGGGSVNLVRFFGSKTMSPFKGHVTRAGAIS